MPDKLTTYKQAQAPLPERNRLWPLYGAGFESLGRGGQPIEIETPTFGPDELLVRHDAVGLCFSDIKIIRLGEDHPRIYRNMKENPVVQGHEVSMTVVGVGENLRDQYTVGDRFIIQADIYYDGVNLAYGYEIQGGLSSQILHQNLASQMIHPIDPHRVRATDAMRAGFAVGQRAILVPLHLIEQIQHLIGWLGLHGIGFEMRFLIDLRVVPTNA